MEATFEDVEDEGEGNDWLNFQRVAETQRVWFGPPVQRVVERGPTGIQRVWFGPPPLQQVVEGGPTGIKRVW